MLWRAGIYDIGSGTLPVVPRRREPRVPVAGGPVDGIASLTGLSISSCFISCIIAFPRWELFVRDVAPTP